MSDCELNSSTSEESVVTNVRELEEDYLGTISDRFDKVYRIIKRLEDEDKMDLSKEYTESLIVKNIKELEEITQIISALNLFKINQSVDEIKPTTLKYLLLPYLLCVLWHKKFDFRSPEMYQICKIYLEDFIERILDYSIIHKPPTVYLRSKNWSFDPKASAPDFSHSGYVAAAEKRVYHNELNELITALDYRIQTLNERLKRGDKFDDETLKVLYLNLIKRAAIDSEFLFENLLMEMSISHFSLTSFALSDSQTLGHEVGNPCQTFFLTRREDKKEVCYPDIPEQTVGDSIIADTGSQGQEPEAKTPPPEEDEETISEELAEKMDDLSLSENHCEDDDMDDSRHWGNCLNL